MTIGSASCSRGPWPVFGFFGSSVDEAPSLWGPLLAGSAVAPMLQQRHLLLQLHDLDLELILAVLAAQTRVLGQQLLEPRVQPGVLFLQRHCDLLRRLQVRDRVDAQQARSMGALSARRSVDQARRALTREWLSANEFAARCQLHGIEPWSSLRDLSCLLPSWPRRRVLNLAPARWQATLEEPETQRLLGENVFRSATLVAAPSSYASALELAALFEHRQIQLAIASSAVPVSISSRWSGSHLLPTSAERMPIFRRL
jgi:hypothetical protein